MSGDSGQPGGVWMVTVPYRYRDLEREIDLIEEIARVYGFCETLPDKTEAGYLSVEQQLIQAARSVGLTELPLLFEAREKTGGAGKPFLQNTPLCGELLWPDRRVRVQPVAGKWSLNAFEIGSLGRGRIGRSRRDRRHFRWRSHPREVDEEAVTNL